MIKKIGLVSALIVATSLTSACSPQTTLESFPSPTPLGTSNNEAQNPQDTIKTEEVDSKYVEYSPTALENARDKKRVLFFHATWCPTCKQAHQDISKNLTKIPENIIIFRTNYDTEKELKNQYAITYQHTFVQIDDNGKA